MSGVQVYGEVQLPEKLVFVQAFSDREGVVVHHPMALAWPLRMFATVTCKVLGNNRARLTSR